MPLRLWLNALWAPQVHRSEKTQRSYFNVWWSHRCSPGSDSERLSNTESWQLLQSSNTTSYSWVWTRHVSITHTQKNTTHQVEALHKSEPQQGHVGSCIWPLVSAGLELHWWLRWCKTLQLRCPRVRRCMVAQALRKCGCWKRTASRSLPIWGLVLSPSSGWGPQRDRPAATTNQRTGHSLKKVRSAVSRGWLAASLVCWFSTPGINRRTQMAQFRRTKRQSTRRTLSCYHFWARKNASLHCCWIPIKTHMKKKMLQPHFCCCCCCYCCLIRIVKP